MLSFTEEHKPTLQPNLLTGSEMTMLSSVIITILPQYFWFATQYFWQIYASGCKVKALRGINRLLVTVRKCKMFLFKLLRQTRLVSRTICLKQFVIDLF